MDIEATVIRYLSTKVGYLVASDVPNPRPDYMVTVERTGGPCEYGIDRPTMAIQCWAPTRAEAASLVYEVSDALEGITEIEEVVQLSINSTYNWPTEKNEQRYQMVVDLVCYR